jgi:hypothetical protein
VKEVRWDKGDTVRAGDYNFFYGNGNENQFGTGIFVHHRIVSAAQKVEFVSNRISYTVLRGCCGDIIVLNVHALSGKKVMIHKTVFMRNSRSFFLSFSSIQYENSIRRC